MTIMSDKNPPNKVLRTVSSATHRDLRYAFAITKRPLVDHDLFRKAIDSEGGHVCDDHIRKNVQPIVAMIEHERSCIHHMEPTAFALSRCDVYRPIFFLTVRYVKDTLTGALSAMLLHVMSSTAPHHEKRQCSH